MQKVGREDKEDVWKAFFLGIFFLNRPIPFEDVLIILVSIFFLLRDERKGGESVRISLLGE